MASAKQRLTARVEAMSESEAESALELLDESPLTAAQRDGIAAAMDAMDRGEGVAHEQAAARLLARFDGQRKRASGV